MLRRASKGAVLRGGAFIFCNTRYDWRSIEHVRLGDFELVVYGLKVQPAALGGTRFEVIKFAMV